MKGLLLKDAYLSGKLCRAFFLLDIIFIAIYAVGEGNMFFLFYPCIISGMLPMTLISYDEREKWDKYAGTLPYTRAQLVSAKYTIGLCSSALVIVLSSIAQAIKLSKDGSLSIENYLTFIFVLMCISLLAPTLLYPLVFKFGAEKGRIFYYVVIGMACAGSTFLMTMDTYSPPKMNDFMTILLTCAGAIVLYIASWLLSIHFYEKREL